MAEGGGLVGFAAPPLPIGLPFTFFAGEALGRKNFESVRSCKDKTVHAAL